MKILKTIILILFYNASFGQDSTMYLHSWKNPNKVDKIANNIVNNVNAIEKDSSGNSFNKSFRGLLLYVRQNEIVMTINSEDSETKLANGTTVINETQYIFPDSLKKIKDVELRTININSINYVSHFTEKGISNVGGAIAVMSVITGLFIAPLVSINYKTGNFNQIRYYSVLAGGAMGFAIGIPLNVIFRKNKHYKIKTYTPDPCDNNYYSIQTK
jgi:hypothetical protein